MYPCIDCGKLRTKESRRRPRCKSCSKRSSLNPRFGLPPKNKGVYKGERIGYSGIHMWIRGKYGKASKCNFCFRQGAKRYEWANKTGNYLMDRDDWYELCKSCHVKYDYARKHQFITI